jgi:putative transport protein
MIEAIKEMLISNPVLLLFLVLAIGFLIGGIRFGNFQLGPVAGVLIAGLLFGHLGFVGNPAIQSFGFVLFMISVGYQAGPKFIQALKKDGRRYLVIAVIVAVSGFGLALIAARILNFEPGIAAGLLAGSLTSTPTLAAADATVLSTSFVVPDGMDVEEIRTNINSAYAITYIFGLVGLILVIRLLPGMLKINLADEAIKLEREDSEGGPKSVFSPSDIVVRAFRLESEEHAGRTLEEIYKASPYQFTIQKIRRDGELFEPSLETVLQIGDLISIVGIITPELFEKIGDKVIGPVARDRELLQYHPETDQICVTRKYKGGLTLGDLNIAVDHASFVSRITRLGVNIEVSPSTPIERGDVLHVTGPGAGLENLGDRLGHLEREIEKTDLSTFSWAIVFGILLGALSIKVAGVDIGLGSAGGLLVLGLLIGYLRSIFPVFGRVPDAARWIFTELGLLLFMAGVGLRGGSGLVETLVSSGLALVLIGIAVTLVPLTLAYIFGRKVQKMNPLMLLGTITGAMTSGGALSVINAQSNSSIANIGYTGAYAFANVLLTVAGAVIALL